MAFSFYMSNLMQNSSSNFFKTPYCPFVYPSSVYVILVLGTVLWHFTLVALNLFIESQDGTVAGFCEGTRGPGAYKFQW
jgi:hypothetical protein